MRPGRAPASRRVAVGRDAVYAAITENVIGSVHVFTHGRERLDGHGDWRCRGGGAADIVSVNDFGPEALFSFQNYLTPPTLYFDRRQ